MSASANSTTPSTASTAAEDENSTVIAWILRIAVLVGMVWLILALAKRIDARRTRTPKGHRSSRSGTDGGTVGTDGSTVGTGKEADTRDP